MRSRHDESFACISFERRWSQQRGSLSAGIATFLQKIYKKFTAKGDLTKGAVYEKWNTIWKTDLDRSYTADFEIYGEAAQNPLNAEVDIFIAVNS